MEHTKKKMAQARQQRKRLQNSPQRDTGFVRTGHGSTVPLARLTLYIAQRHNSVVFLAGAVAGIVVIAMVWWMIPAGMSGDTGSIAMQAAGELQAANTAAPEADTPGISKQIDDIALLNERVNSLHNTIMNLEVKLMRVLVLADAFADVDSKVAADHTGSIFDTLEPAAAGTAPAAHDTGMEFIPTHTVKTRLNLRPSASVKTTPITLLAAGTPVEYISGTGDWYYVNTEASGQGWCSSSYLSSIR